MTHSTKTDAQLLNCGCAECKAELAYRDHHRRFPGSKATKELLADGQRGDYGRPFTLMGRLENGPDYHCDAASWDLRFRRKPICPVIHDALEESNIYE